MAEKSPDLVYFPCLFLPFLPIRAKKRAEKFGAPKAQKAAFFAPSKRQKHPSPHSVSENNYTLYLVQSQVSKTIYGVKTTYNFVEKISLNLLILPIDKFSPQISSITWKNSRNYPHYAPQKPSPVGEGGPLAVDEALLSFAQTKKAGDKPPLYNYN